MDIHSHILRLLHIEEDRTNKFIDLGCRDGLTFDLSDADGPGFGVRVWETVRRTRGLTATTILRKSAIAVEEHALGAGFNIFDWCELESGIADPKVLEQFRRNARSTLSSLGNNSAFVSIGALRWSIPVGPNNEMRQILSPLVIVPVELIRSGTSAQPVSLKFVDDNIFFNPSFYERLRVEQHTAFFQGFPVPEGDVDDLDIANLDIGQYFDRVSAYLAQSAVGEKMSFEPDLVCLSKYDNPDICMYHDIKRNLPEILAHPLIRAIFGSEVVGKLPTTKPGSAVMVRAYDSAQLDIVEQVAGGANLVVKGPPGTGKTQTIANMISTLLAEGKRVLFVSKKISALTEVYNKLPQSIRNFLLRLDYENERDRIDVPKVHQELLAARNYRPQTAGAQLMGARTAAVRNSRAATDTLQQYKKLMFDLSRFLDGVYFDVLDGYCRDIDLAPVDFDLPVTALNLSMESYRTSLSRVSAASQAWRIMTDNGRFDAAISPWIHVRDQAAADPSVLGRASALAESLAVIDTAPDLRLLEDLDLASMAQLTGYRLSVEDTANLLGRDSVALGRLVELGRQTVAEFGQAPELVEWALAGDPEVFVNELGHAQQLAEALADDQMHLVVLRRIQRSPHIYADQTGLRAQGSRLASLTDLLERRHQALQTSQQNHQLFAEVFGQPSPAATKVLGRATAELDKLVVRSGSNQVQHDKLVKKGWYKKALALSLNPQYTTPLRLVPALVAYGECTRADAQVQATTLELGRIFGRELTSDECNDLRYVIELSHAGNIAELTTFVERQLRSHDAVLAAYATIGIEHGDYLTVGGLRQIFALNARLRALQQLTAEVMDTQWQTATMAQIIDIGTQLDTISALLRLADLTQQRLGRLDADLVHRAIVEIVRLDSQRQLGQFVRDLQTFYTDNFRRSIYAQPSLVSLADARQTMAHITDSAYRAAAVNFANAIADDALDLAAFFEPFERGDRPDPTADAGQGVTFQAIFAHSYYALVNRAVVELLGDQIHGCSRSSIDSAIRDFCTAEQQIATVNADIVAALLSSMITPDSAEFDFLANRPNASVPCRLYFRKYAQQILKLKRCLLMSPSTISVLLRPEDFRHFDAVIIDEASQMPPEYIIPAVYRARQCIVVGDENQMPPVKFFAKRLSGGDNDVPDDEWDGLIRIDSALALVLASNVFQIRQLVSHYRSETETLISYSQAAFYPDMVTFPSVVPRKTFATDGVDLGLIDILTPNGTSTGGQNLAEAESVLSQVRHLFDCYYDAERQRLTQSIGIITFGLKQADLIQSMIAGDPELASKVQNARRNTDGAPETAFFVSTVLTVQGMEADHIIMSVTYCRSPEGRVATNYGALSMVGLGKQVFNVAVSRARRSVRVIHSLPASQVAVEHVRDYLALVAKFDSDESSVQFGSCDRPPNHFERSVGDCLVGFGLSPDRIVYNYGVNATSFRLPIAVLNAQRTQAVLGIMCESRLVDTDLESYIDRVIRYNDVLRNRGWQLHPLYVFDWVVNNVAERQRLQQIVQNLI